MKVSISSNPRELELLKLEITLSTSSGCTAFSEKEHFLPSMSDLSLASGSVTAGGRLSLIVENLKNNCFVPLQFPVALWSETLGRTAGLGILKLSS